MSVFLGGDKFRGLRYYVLAIMFSLLQLINFYSVLNFISLCIWSFEILYDTLVVILSARFIFFEVVSNVHLFLSLSFFFVPFVQKVLF